MPNCTTVIQTASDLFEPEIRLNSPKNDTFRPFIRVKNLPKSFGIVQLILVISRLHYTIFRFGYAMLLFFQSITKYYFSQLFACNPCYCCCCYCVTNLNILWKFYTSQFFHSHSITVMQLSLHILCKHPVL